ncbi:unnamed protein product [Wuchereria bancrofti]|uniref:Uncharacterized protein n=1 Tax=Wuchereria bancrofti TaxID=6293 RepID=A0A3P7FQV7_WUCBA|nr:unnamed protein product [Wuchereria bancrofti]
MMLPKYDSDVEIMMSTCGAGWYRTSIFLKLTFSPKSSKASVNQNASKTNEDGCTAAMEYIHPKKNQQLSRNQFGKQMNKKELEVSQNAVFKQRFESNKSTQFPL